MWRSIFDLIFTVWTELGQINPNCIRHYNVYLTVTVLFWCYIKIYEERGQLIIAAHSRKDYVVIKHHSGLFTNMV